MIHTHTHTDPHWAHTDHKWGCFCCCFCCSWLVLNWPKVEKALWVCMAKQSKHVSVTFLCRRFVLHVSVFLFCIYFMPGEKYNLFSCPESGAKMRSGLHYSARLGQSPGGPPAVTHSYHMSVSFYTVHTVLHTFRPIKTGSTHCSAWVGNTLKIKLSFLRFIKW